MTIAEDKFTEMMSKEAERSVAALTAELEDKSMEDFAAMFGIDPQDEDAAARIGLQLGLSQLSTALVAQIGSSVSRESIIEMGANARAPILIEIDRDAERVLTDMYEGANPALAKKFFSQPGTAENIEADRSLIELHHFADGSLCGHMQSASASNARTRIALISSASTLSDAVSKEESEPMLKMMREACESITVDIAPTAKNKKEIDQVIEKSGLQLMLAIARTSMGSISVPLAEIAQSAEKLLKKSIDKDGSSWKSGVKVAVDGADCPTPAAFNDALGIKPAATLDDVLARLRSTRAPAEPEAAAERASPAKAPKRH